MKQFPTVTHINIFKISAFTLAALMAELSVAGVADDSAATKTAHAPPLATPLAATVAHARADAGASGVEIRVSCGFSGAADARLPGVQLGGVSVRNTDFQGFKIFRFSEETQTSIGFLYRNYSVDAAYGIPVSKAYHSLSLDIGSRWRLDDDWTLGATIKPGFYGDDARLFDSAAFSIPTAFFAEWKRGDAFSLVFGAAYSGFAEYPALPLFGVRWAMSPEWVLSLGVPSTSLSYGYGKGRSVFLAAHSSGGSFHTDDSNLPSDFRDTKVSYRETRLGGGIAYPLFGIATLRAECGWMLDRKFDYHERGNAVKTDGAAYLQIVVSSKF